MQSNTLNTMIDRYANQTPVNYTDEISVKLQLQLEALWERKPRPTQAI